MALLVLPATLPVTDAGFVATAQNSANSFASGSCFHRATVQSGSTTNTTNGPGTVAITPVDTAKSFLLFSTSHNSSQPVGSLIRGRVASATTIEFDRVTDEASPTPITIQWSVIEYDCGVNVQRGAVTQDATIKNVPITAVSSLTAAFVTYSKTPAAGDGVWDRNDPVVAELTSTTNLQLRVDATGGLGDHEIWWQVIEFQDPTMINVQKGTTTLTGATTSVDATITAVDTARTFVLATARSSGTGSDIGSGSVRARITNSTTITIDRSATNYDVTEISWQAIELRDGSTVQSGSATLASGNMSTTAALTAVDLARSSAFASTQTGGGQNGGRTPYTANDIVGVAAFTTALTSPTQLTLTRSNAAGSADVAWFVVSWGPT